MDILKLSGGKVVQVDAAELTQAEAMELARRLFDMWGFQHPRVKRTLIYEVQTKGWNDCPHIAEDEPDAIEEIQRLLLR